MENIFERFPYFIQDFIYANHWQSLRPAQISAAQTIFYTNHNLLLSTSTASGKTEAAFFPILTDLYENPCTSISILYIAPLKSLINDQFLRMQGLLDASGIPVTHWHGDVSVSEKKRLLLEPNGLLQITPESMESMLINRSNDCVRLFGDLRYVIIDEVHTLMGSDRGNQILCQLSRLAHIIGHHPRRIGLSATIGDLTMASSWLGSGSPYETDAPVFPSEKTTWRIGLEHFYVQNQENDPKNADVLQNKDENFMEDEGYSFIYDYVYGRKSIAFSNSREETEYLCATLRQIAKGRKDEDLFMIHHGNLSASIREEAELAMKNSDEKLTTCATVTMELGIDIGQLECVLQNQAPTSVSSFLQRLGRSGRRTTPPEMMMVFREENPLPNTPLPQLIPWDLLRAIAIIQLYIEERFIEPPNIRSLPVSLLFHQTLSILASSGEQTPKKLKEIILALPPFQKVSEDDYKTLLLEMLNKDYIELTDERTLIIGLAGEKLIKSFKFYAVFKDSEDYTVRCGSDEIGTITTPPPVGDRFALAGHVWEVEELDLPHKLIYVKAVNGKMEVSWPGDFGEIHTKILERMKKVLQEDIEYPYLKEHAKKRLQAARHVARATGMLENNIVHLGGYSWCIFPWLGTKSFRALRKMLLRLKDDLKLCDIEHDGCNYITFKMVDGQKQDIIDALSIISQNELTENELLSPGELPFFEKYDGCVPASLLRKAFIQDRLNIKEACLRIQEF